MAKIYLLENIERGLKECYSNLKKISDVYPISYWGLSAAIKNKNVYRKDGYLVTKMMVK